MATKIYLRRGTLAELQNVVLESGEPAWTTDTHAFYVGDGVTSGGVFIEGAGAGVTSLNTLINAITVQGAGGVNVTEVGQAIIVSGADVGTYVDSLNNLTGDITASGAGIIEVTISGQYVMITGTETDDVDSLNALVGNVTISGVGGTVVDVQGQIITISGGAGETEFNALTDTPASYAGSRYRTVRVNAAEDGVERGGLATASGAHHQEHSVRVLHQVGDGLVIPLSITQGVNRHQ